MNNIEHIKSNQHDSNLLVLLFSMICPIFGVLASILFLFNRNIRMCLVNAFVCACTIPMWLLIFNIISAVFR